MLSVTKRLARPPLPRLPLRLAALLLLVAAHPASAADLAPGAPPLTQDLADLRRDAVEVSLDIQFTARQLREHQRLYAWHWKYATADRQKAEAAFLPAFRGAFEKTDADRKALREKHRAALLAEAKERAEKGSPYHRWLLATADRAAEVIAAGPPPLRRDALENTLEFIQWVLRMQLTVRQQEEFLRLVPAEWNRDTAKADRETIINEFLPVYRKVVRLAPGDRTAVRNMAEPLLLDALKKPETPLDRWLAGAHAEANKVLAAGPPDALTAGATDQQADFYDWALGLRLADDTRAELRKLIVQDWTTIESTRRGTLDTARLMDDPPGGGAGELSRLRDRASTLLFVCGQPKNVVNRATMDVYRKAHPGVEAPILPDSRKVLADGAPPLTEGEAECSRMCFEWLFGFTFTADQRAAFRKTQLDEWARKDKASMEGTLDNAFLYTQLMWLTPEDRELVRAFTLPDFLKVMRETKDTDPGNKWLLEQYEARYPSLVKGKPGPTQADADALGELLRFQTREVTGGDAGAAEKVATVAVEKVKSGVGAVHEVTGAAQQLALIRYAWPTLNEADRQELRDRWADSLRPLGVNPKLAVWQATPSPAREIDSVAAWRALQAQQQNTAMISNMLRMQHQTNMTIIRNMGSTPYRYEYKYEYRRR
ncbi:hypothetical protein GobsT_49460 [Gemmata obscuriglobus]|uniref:hypothetical protein n=1 Tax=Gemmata obscuriglobus TaxID=114 RepID=UPI0011CD0419|nr:hypothetical protein [Gemmata obscuriglobus]QEG30145.1 hypothetical protein GobsT_49460 [Gemmata obscuriglobus]VTS09466.1 Uncharacterized protein OS=Gemmatimonadetes bacterium KBS708 GN=J421_5874 PE=4 SV=1 [Gemmata obscuriglobus UQM 2246]